MQSTLITSYSGIIDTSEYPEPYHIPAAVYSDPDDDTEDTEESSPALISKLLDYSHAHVHKPSGSGRPKAITSLDELFKPSYDMPMESSHPASAHGDIFGRSAKSHEQMDNNLPLFGKSYGKPPNHLPISYQSSTSVPSAQQQLRERVNARFSTATIPLSSPIARRTYGRRNSYYNNIQDNSLAMSTPPSSTPLSRTPSLSVSSSASCESLASSSASHVSSIPTVMSRSNSQNRIHRNNVVSTDTPLLLINTKVVRRSSSTRIPTGSSTPVATTISTVASTPAVTAVGKPMMTLSHSASDPMPNRRYSTLEAASQSSSAIRPIRSYRSSESIYSTDSTLDENDNAQRLLISIRTRHDRLISMLDNIRSRIAQVRQSWEDDENGRQQYIARLRHSVLLEHDLPAVEPYSPINCRQSHRSGLPIPSLPVKSIRRSAPMSPGVNISSEISHVSSDLNNDHNQRVSSTASSILTPIVEVPATRLSTPASSSTSSSSQPTVASKRNIERRRSGLPTLSSRPRSRLL